jgi:hypothetical protein
VAEIQIQGQDRLNAELPHPEVRQSQITYMKPAAVAQDAVAQEPCFETRMICFAVRFLTSAHETSLAARQPAGHAAREARGTLHRSFGPCGLYAAGLAISACASGLFPDSILR